MRSIGDIISSVKQSLQSLGSPLGNFSRYSNIYALLRSVASIIAEQDYRLATTQQSFYLMTATGDDLDLRALDFGLYRKAGTYGTGWVLISSASPYVLPENLVLSSADSQYQYKLTKAVTTGGGEFAIPMQSLTKGTDINLSAGTRLYSSFFPGVTFTIGRYRDPLTNEPQIGVTGGRDPESDFAFRSRVMLYLRSLNLGTLEFIQSAVLSVEEVSRVFIKEHTPVTGYFTVYVDSQDSAILNEVEALISQNKAAGVSYLIDSIVSVPVNVNILLKVSPFADSNQVLTSVRALISNYFDNLSLGESIRPNSLAAIALQVEGVLDAVMFNPTDEVTPAAGNLITLSNLSITLQS